MTAHGAKGLEFAHVIVMDCADWRWTGADEQRLLYVAMTRAQQSLVLMRAEGGRNPHLVDLGTVKGVVDLLPDVRPAFRPDIDRRYVTIGPAEVDIGYAGRSRPENRLHQDIASLRVGDGVVIAGRLLETAQRQAVGRLAARTKLEETAILKAKVCGLLVRTRDQTQAAYADSVKADRWEVVLVEVEMGGAVEGAADHRPMKNLRPGLSAPIQI